MGRVILKKSEGIGKLTSKINVARETRKIL